MSYDLQANTEPGHQLVAMAESFAPTFLGRVAAHDSEGSFPFESLRELQESGYLYAPIPVEFGGMGVESVHDVLVAASRLARGDAGLTLGVNMHMIMMMTYAQQYRAALATGDEAKATGVGRAMARAASDRMVIAAAVSEPDQELIRPQTTARPDGDEWVIDGHKIFISMAPAATHFSVAVSYIDPAGDERYGYMVVPADAPGVTVNNDWDALGMRDSGSTSVTFNGVRMKRGPGSGVLAGIITAEHLELILTSGPSHAASAVGVAEAAYELGIRAFRSKLEKKGERAFRPTFQHLAAENSVDLAAIRAIFDRSLRGIDEYQARHLTGHGDDLEANAVFSDVQRAKIFINQAVLRVVDRAMTIAGGAAYTAGSPLARLYRDARAGAFMHPLGANVAYEYVGAEALGLRPTTL